MIVDGMVLMPTHNIPIIILKNVQGAELSLIIELIEFKPKLIIVYIEK